MLTVTYLSVRSLEDWLKQHEKLHTTNERHKSVDCTKLRHKQRRKNEKSEMKYEKSHNI